MTLRLFMGWDKREARGGHAFIQSVLENTSVPVSLTVITEQIAESLGVETDGSNAFSKCRFLVPYLCDFKGYAIYVDGVDMIALGDLAQLWDLRKQNAWMGIAVAPHDYRTKHSRKYIGTEMECANEDYPRKNQSSCVLWNNAYSPHGVLTPEFVAKQPGSFLHRFEWMQEERIGELPLEWNWLCDEYGASTTAKLLHFTLGTPNIRHYAKTAHESSWFIADALTRQEPAEMRKAASA